jgi:nitrite transporter NirC
MTTPFFVGSHTMTEGGSMHMGDHERFAAAAAQKAALVTNGLGRYLLLSMAAGAYVGFGIALICSLGGPFAAAGSPALKLIMAGSFGIALTLVMCAGSELFTGNNMIGVIGGLSGSVSWAQVVQLNVWSWLGNLVGSLAFAWLVVQSGVFVTSPPAHLIETMASGKMSLGPWELFLRGLLCNWLICLAVWMAGRATSDSARIMLIFWCLFAFIGIGLEHSVANQSLLGMALFLPHEAGVSWGGFWYNQVFVVLGNLVGGGVCVGGLYWLVSPYRVTASETGVLPHRIQAEAVRT